MSQAVTTDPRAEIPPFEVHVYDVVTRIRSAFAELLVSVDADPTSPQDISRQFDLNKNLTWKISRLIRESDPAACAPFIPGKTGLTKFLDRLKKAGAPVKFVSEARAALADFEEMMDLHAGDRETFETMLGHLANGADAQQQPESQRRLAFRGNSAIWGVQARIQICTNFLAPGSDPERCDLAWLSGLVDFKRLRRDATWAIASTRKVDDKGNVLPLGDMQSIDPSFRGDSVAPLMGDFCSDPHPELRLNVGGDGLLRYELVEGPVGNVAAATCIVGIIGRQFLARYSAPGDTLGEHIARLYTPVECLIHDIFVHRELDHALAPTAHLYSQLPINPVYPKGGRESALLPLREKIQSLGNQPPVALTPELPQYRSMVDRVFQTAGWDPRDFHGYRLIVHYPPIPTVAVFRYPLAERK